MQSVELKREGEKSAFSTKKKNKKTSSTQNVNDPNCLRKNADIKKAETTSVNSSLIIHFNQPIKPQESTLHDKQSTKLNLT